MKIDHSHLKAKPEEEDFAGKYQNTNAISQYLVNNYFKSVIKLISQTKEVHKAHEIGVGEGHSTLRIKNYLENLSASEFLQPLVEKAKSNNPDIKIFQESVYELKYESESVDLIFLLEVLEHLDYPQLALKEIHRVSKKYLIIGVPNEPFWRILNVARLKYLNSLGNTPGHINHWSKKSFIDLIKKNFGEVIAIESPIPWTIILAKKNENLKI